MTNRGLATRVEREPKRDRTSANDLVVVEKSIRSISSSTKTGRDYLESMKAAAGKQWVENPHLSILDAFQVAAILQAYNMLPKDRISRKWMRGVIHKRDAVDPAELVPPATQFTPEPDKKLKVARADVFPEGDSRYSVGFVLDEEGVQLVHDDAEALFEHFDVPPVYDPASVDEQPHATVMIADSEQYANYLAGNFNAVLGDSVELAVVPSPDLVVRSS